MWHLQVREDIKVTPSGRPMRTVDDLARECDDLWPSCTVDDRADTAYIYDAHEVYVAYAWKGKRKGKENPPRRLKNACRTT